MNILLKMALFFLVALYVFFSCKKDKQQKSITSALSNRSPIARAGADLSHTVSSCTDLVSIELDGSSSTDPDNNIMRYSWVNLYGPQGHVLRNSTQARAIVQIMSIGEYAFVLTVTDAFSVSSTDTIVIRVIRPPDVPKEYNLDIADNGTFRFDNNVTDCYYFNPCLYYDYSEIEGKGIFQPFGEFNIYFSQNDDTSDLNFAGTSYISMRNNNNTSIYGTTSVNLKKLIKQGGGSFLGTFTVTDGSAKRCEAKIFDGVSPLNLTGSLDTATKKVSLRIYGKTFF